MRFRRVTGNAALWAILAAASPAPAVAQGDLDNCVAGLRATEHATYDLAIHYCSRVIREGRIPAETQQWLLSQRAHAYAGKGDADRAREDQAEADQLLAAVLYEQALRANPESAYVFLYAGIQQGRRGNFDIAANLFTEAIDRDPDVGIAYYNRGLSLLYLGQAQKSLDDFDRSVELLPSFALARFNRAWVSQALGDNDQALIDYTETIRLAPQFTDAYNNRGFVYEALGETRLALDDFLAAARLDPTNRAYLTKARQLSALLAR